MLLSPLSSAFTLLVLNGCKYDSACPLVLSYSVGFTSEKSVHNKLKSVTSDWFCLTCFSSEDFKYAHDWLTEFFFKNQNLPRTVFVCLLLSLNRDLAQGHVQCTHNWPLCCSIFLPLSLCSRQNFMAKEGHWGHPWYFSIDAIKDKESSHGYLKILKGLFWWSFSSKKKIKAGLGSAPESVALEILVKTLVLTWALVAFRAQQRVRVWGLKWSR